MTYFPGKPSAGIKNFIIGGDFTTNPWQRGTSITRNPTVSNGYGPDRFYHTQYGNTVDEEIISRDGTNAAPGGWYYLKLQQYKASGFSGGNSRIVHIVDEDLVSHYLQGKTVTFSFWYKTPTSFTNAWSIYGRYDTDASTCNTTVNPIEGAGTSIFSESLTQSTSWQRYIKTFTVNASARRLLFVLATNDNAVNGAIFGVDQFQLELGNVATDFEARSPAQELALCQRYYEKSYEPGTIPGATDATNAVFRTEDTSWLLSAVDINFNVIKRVTPTVTTYSVRNFNTTGVCSEYDAGGTFVADRTMTAGGRTKKGFGLSSAGTLRNTAGDYIYIHWVAEAEI